MLYLDSMNGIHEVKEAADFIQSRLLAQSGNTVPRMGLVLGSGLGELARSAENGRVLSMGEIPHWPRPSVAGHAGQLILGEIDSVPVLIQQGRVHYYEGHPLRRVVFPVRVMAELGIDRLIFTHAGGGLNPEFSAGDLMLVEDHINFMFHNPLMGPNDFPGDRFPDMSCPYDLRFRQLAIKAAARLSIPLRKGVLVACTGPSYETAAEVRMLRQLGGDCVCMSTVPEVIAGVHAGMRLMAISCITNPATGLGHGPLSHDEVKTSARKLSGRLTKLIAAIINEMNQ